MIKNLQALRGVAALLVLWNHCQFSIQTAYPHFSCPRWLGMTYGSMGVDIFFVISGYVIALTAAKKHQGALEFLCHRIARVVPLYFVATVLAILLALDNPALRHNLNFNSLWNGFFYLPFFDFHHYTGPPHSLGWTLSFEMWFYLVFAGGLLLWPAARVARFLPLFFAAGAVLVSLFYRSSWYFPCFAFYPHVLEFSFGCLIFNAGGLLKGRAAVFLLVAGFLFFAWSSQANTHFASFSPDVRMGWLRVAAWGVPSAMVVAGLLGLEMSGGYVLPNWLFWVGEMSFSFYLVQRFVITLSSRIVQMIHHQPIWLPAIICIALNFLLGYPMWRWIERPLTIRAKDYFDRRLGVRHKKDPTIAPKTAPATG